MKIGIFYTTTNKSTRKSCEIFSDKVNADVCLIPIERAKGECILKYNYIILAASAVNGKVQKELKRYTSRYVKNLGEKPLGLIINCEEDTDRFIKTFTEEVVSAANIKSNFGYEIDPDEGNYLEKRKNKKLIDDYKRNNKELPGLNYNEIDKFTDYMNNIIEKRID